MEGKPKEKIVYIKVTNDEYELPEFVADSITELAKMTGTNLHNISSALSKTKHKGTKSSYKKVVIDDEE